MVSLITITTATIMPIVIVASRQMLNDHAVSANKPGDLVGCCESASVGFCEAKCEELSNMEVIREGFIVEPGKGW